MWDDGLGPYLAYGIRHVAKECHHTRHDESRGHGTLHMPLPII